MGAIARYYSNTAVQGTIGNPGGISNAATSMYLTSTPVGYPNQYPFTLCLDPSPASATELVSVTAGAGTSASPWTIQRGYDGTLAQAHNQGSVVTHDFSAGDFASAATHAASDNTSMPLPHGLPASAWGGSVMSAISSTSLSNSTTSVVTLASIPQTYSHLLLVVQARLTSATITTGAVQCTLNGDSAAKYSSVTMGADTITGSISNPPYAFTSASQTQWGHFLTVPGSQSGAVVNAGGGIAWFPNYSGTTFAKFCISLSGFGDATDTLVLTRLQQGFYKPGTQAGVSAISLAASAGFFTSGSDFTLYGIA